jgi:hypothetical protein
MTAQDNVTEGTKIADIQVSTTHPIVSAWEFEFLKQERVTDVGSPAGFTVTRMWIELHQPDAGSRPS